MLSFVSSFYESFASGSSLVDVHSCRNAVSSKQSSESMSSRSRSDPDDAALDAEINCCSSSAMLSGSLEILFGSSLH